MILDNSWRIEKLCAMDFRYWVTKTEFAQRRFDCIIWYFPISIHIPKHINDIKAESFLLMIIWGKH